MTSVNFQGRVTVIPASWANAVNTLLYDVLGGAQTASQVRNALGLGSLSLQSASSVDIQGGYLNNVVIGNHQPSSGTFQRAQVLEPGAEPSDVLNRGATQQLADQRILNYINTNLISRGDLLVRGTTGTSRLPIGVENAMLLAVNIDAEHGMSWINFTQLAEQNPQNDPGQRGAAGDLLIRTATEFIRLPVGQDGQLLMVDSTQPQKVRWGGSNFLLPLREPGDLLTIAGSDLFRLPVGIDGQALVADSTEPWGLRWKDILLPSLTNKGDLLTRNASGYSIQPIGDNNDVLIADSAEANGMKWMPLDDLVPLPTLERNVPVIGTNVGAVPEGFTFAQGTTFTQFVELISTKAVPPVYTQPSLSLSGNPAPQNFEIGTNLVLTFTRAFSQNSAGASTARRLMKNGTQLATVFPVNDPVQLTAVPLVYQAQEDYAQGPILNNNLGQPSPTGRIEAGTVVSGLLSYVGRRCAFYGTPSFAAVDSASVRGLTSSFASDNNSEVNSAGVSLVPAPNPNFTISIPAGAQRVVFAYPADRRPVASVKYQELSDSEVKGNFVETQVLVEGANGFAPVAYRVYTYTPVEPFSVPNHYKVFI